MSPTILVDVCSLKLIGELTIQVFSFTWSKLAMMESQEDDPKETFSSLKRFCLTIQQLLLKTVQRSFKFMLPSSWISDDKKGFWKVCHHQSSCECTSRSTGNWQGGNSLPYIEPFAFLEKERWMRPRIQQKGSDRIPTNHPSSHPSMCPVNSGLARPLAQST